MSVLSVNTNVDKLHTNMDFQKLPDDLVHGSEAVESDQEQQGAPAGPKEKGNKRPVIESESEESQEEDSVLDNKMKEMGVASTTGNPLREKLAKFISI